MRRHLPARRSGQILIVFAILILVMVFFLAWVVDGGRIAVRRAETRRAAEAAAQAGMVVVGDQMLTQAVARQTQAAASPCGTCTATPEPQDIPAWLTDEDRATLVAQPMQTAVAAAAQDYAERNQAGPGSPNIVDFAVTYPFEYQPLDRNVELKVRIRRNLVVLLVGVLNREQAELTEEGQAALPQRK